MGFTNCTVEWSHLLDIHTFNGKKYSGKYSYLNLEDDKVAVFVRTRTSVETIKQCIVIIGLKKIKNEYPTYTFIDV